MWTFQYQTHYEKDQLEYCYFKYQLFMISIAIYSIFDKACRSISESEKLYYKVNS